MLFSTLVYWPLEAVAQCCGQRRAPDIVTPNSEFAPTWLGHFLQFVAEETVGRVARCKVCNLQVSGERGDTSKLM
ncbi:hypothetical protein EDD36DRAFT_446025, partial [Exophiala viscosa]